MVQMVIGSAVLGGLAGVLFLVAVYGTATGRVAVTSVTGIGFAGVAAMVIESGVRGGLLLVLVGSAFAVFTAGVVLFEPVPDSISQANGGSDGEDEEEESGEEYSEITTPQL